MLILLIIALLLIICLLIHIIYILWEENGELKAILDINNNKSLNYLYNWFKKWK